MSALRRRACPSVTPETEALVRALYDDLWDKPGPEPRAVQWAKKYGYAPPMAWDEDTIGDPDATPQHMLEGNPEDAANDPDDVALIVQTLIDDVSRRVPEHLAPQLGPGSTLLIDTAVRDLSAAGRTAAEIAAQLRTTDRTVVRIRTRLGVKVGNRSAGPITQAEAKQITAVMKPRRRVAA